MHIEINIKTKSEQTYLNAHNKRNVSEKYVQKDKSCDTLVLGAKNIFCNM